MKFIGIDGGGTKTIGVVTDQFGNVICSHTVGGTNPNGATPIQVKEQLSSLVTHLLGIVNVEQLAGCFAGMAGVGHPDQRTDMERLLRQLLPDVPLEVDIDPINALYSGSKSGTGVVFISGTGSICFSINARGERRRVGGWGYLLGDEGSGFDFGRRTIEAVMKGFDGRLDSPPAFTARVLDYYQCESAIDLIPIIYGSGAEKSTISAAAPIVFEALTAGDPVAQQIVTAVLNEMVLMIKTALNQLRELAEVESEVVLVGSVFQQQNELVTLLKACVEEEGYSVRWHIPQTPPVAGAVAKAIMNKQGNIPEDFDKQFMTSYMNKLTED